MAAPATKTPLPAFVVDKKGLAKLLERKGKSFAVIELVQNAWDEDTTQVHITLEPLDGGKYRLVVEDDNPEGFKDLRHAYTLFAESLKKNDANKRGRFNLGEKLVIAICECAKISTTKGTVAFIGDERQMLRKKRDAGSVFEGIMRLTADEVKEIESTIRTLLPPHGIETTYNMVEIPTREPLRTFEVSLRTELADADGRLKPTTRKTKVEVYEPLPGEDASIYEMGIPVVPTGDRWHVNVQQKVPLPTDRDNVSPGYLRDLRVAVLNACHDLLSGDDAKQAWVTNAMEDENASGEAIAAAFKGKFGDKAVIFDPTDPEANKIAVEQGYTVVPGGALPKAAWKHIKNAEVVKPAGQVTPSPNPNEGAENLKMMQPEHWPEDIKRVAEFARGLADRLMGADVTVRIANDPSWPFLATYGPRKHKTEGQLTLNLGRLGYKWFEQINGDTIDLLIHEYGHHYESDHLSRGYLNALTMLAGKCVILALEDAHFFFGYGVTQEAVAA